MGDLKDTLTITVESFTGKEEGLEYERPYYVAHCDDIGLVTDGDSLDELLRNLREALSACLEGVDLETEYHLQPQPRIVLTMDMTRSYAQTA